MSAVLKRCWRSTSAVADGKMSTVGSTSCPNRPRIGATPLARRVLPARISLVGLVEWGSAPLPAPSLRSRCRCPGRREGGRERRAPSQALF